MFSHTICQFVLSLPKLLCWDLQIYPLMSDLLTNLNKVCDEAYCSAFVCGVLTLDA